MKTITDIKKALHTLADQLPDNATWADVEYEANFRKQVEAGIAEAERGEFADKEEMEDTFKKWGLQIEA